MFEKDFRKLGEIFADYNNNSILKEIKENLNKFNSWFTPEMVDYQLKGLSDMLKDVEEFGHRYNLENILAPKKRVKIIASGNLPAVCFHDMMCVLLTGNFLVLKQSSKDNILPKAILQILSQINPKIKDFYLIEENQKEEFDAIIATGSNNSSRYFDYYFGKYPHIIRSSRNSIAILKNDISDQEIKLLSDDIFLYFGMGCRSVSKLFLEKGFDINRIFANIIDKCDVMKNVKYSDNYTYNKAIYLMSALEVLDNNFVLLKEDESYNSPVGVIFYQYFDNREDLLEKINIDQEVIQCVVGNFDDSSKQKYPNLEFKSFGLAQKPSIFEFMDRVDTIKFLKNL